MNLTTSKGLKVTLFGALEPTKIKDSLAVQYVLKDIISPIRQTIREYGDSADVTILMLYGSEITARNIAQRLPEIDVIILGGERIKLEQPLINGKTIIVSPGVRGTHMGQLSLSFNDLNKINSYSHELVPLDRSVENEVSIGSLIDPENPITLAEPIRVHQFPFVHETSSSSIRSLYLKDTKTGFDYNLGTREENCRGPLLGAGKDRLLYSCGAKGENRQLYVQSVNSTIPFRITEPHDDILEYAWGPSLHWVYFIPNKTSGLDVYKMTLTGTQKTQVTQGQFGLVNHFDIHPRGDKIAVEAFRHEKSQIWIADLDLKTPLRITGEDENGRVPKWSGSTNFLAYLVEISKEGQKYRLEVFDFKNNNKIIVDENVRDLAFSWSNDGKQIYYASGINVLDINVFDVETGAQQKLCRQHNIVRDERNPRPFYFKGESGILFETLENENSVIRWINSTTKDELILVDLPGNDYLY